MVTKIEVPLIKFDTNGNPKPTRVFLDIENIRGMILRDWEDKGKSVPDMCVLCKTLKISRQAEDQDSSNYFILGMSKEKLMDKLQRNNLAILIS